LHSRSGAGECWWRICAETQWGQGVLETRIKLKISSTWINKDIQNWKWATKLSISFQSFQDLDLCIFLEAAGCAVCSSGTYSEDFDDDGKTRRCAKCSPGYSQGKGLAKLPWNGDLNTTTTIKTGACGCWFHFSSFLDSRVMLRANPLACPRLRRRRFRRSKNIVFCGTMVHMSPLIMAVTLQRAA